MKNFFLVFLIFLSCTNYEKVKKQEIKKKNTKAEYILRSSASKTPLFTDLSPRKRDPYLWENEKVTLSKITKESFKCRGTSMNLPLYNGKIKYEDCLGSVSHSLPIIHNKENVYPILIDLLNYIQDQSKKRVVITCGHRCPLHNRYSDPSKEAAYSKHMIGAEVDFYVEGLEDNPREVIDLIFSFYQNKKYKDEEYQFQRYEKATDVSTKPWFNKEIFIKLYKKDEGRDLDNKHPYAYISLQVRYDRDINERVNYSWENANRFKLSDQNGFSRSK